MKKKVKFCPRCGAQLNLADSYCIRCGYSFKQRKKKINLAQIFVVMLVLLGMWCAIRIFLNKPIIPVGVLDFLKTILANPQNKAR